MAIRSIITAPDPRLKIVSKPVRRVDDEVRRLLDDMRETMYSAPGIGLAAVQVGVPVRAIVMDLARDGEGPSPLHVVNPEVTWVSEDDAVYEEGCLSLPEQFADVARPAAVKVSYLDYHGVRQEIDANGLLATCLQHEMDHLEGVLFVDHLTALKRNIILRRLVKARRQKKSA